ncbi:MAG: hypothetical protein ABJF10_21155 [Chthoniobacter sp.]|uniref:hypothetical protein n=1 Tax=Chthoniobacter sp. TaxID=2510640 RepID=UPI0032A612FE
MIRKFCSLLVVPSLLLGLLASCDEKPKRQVKKPDGTEKKSLGSPDTRFVEARSQMINGHFAEAADALGAISAEPKIRQPLLNWIDFHQGLALMLAGKEDEAQLVFGKIETRGPFTTAGSDSQVATFFMKVATLLHSKEPIAPTEGKDYDKWSYEGIAVLAFAMKDWNLEKYDEATALFRQFTDVAPEKMVDWADGPEDLRKLKEMGDNFVNDYKLFVPANEALQAAKTPQEQNDAVEAAKAARAKMKLTTKMSNALDTQIADIGPKAKAMLAEMSKANAEEMAADAKAFGDAKEKRNDLLEKFQFTEARTAIMDPALKTEQARDEQTLLAKKTQWLANYKSQLVEDLAKKGYAAPFTKKSGDKVLGGVAQADDQQLTLKAVRIPLPWADVSLDAAYEMGTSFIQPDMPPDIAAFRKWHLGVFAFYAGKKKEGLDLLREAAKLRPVFKDELPLFENASGPY